MNWSSLKKNKNNPFNAILLLLASNIPLIIFLDKKNIGFKEFVSACLRCANSLKIMSVDGQTLRNRDKTHIKIMHMILIVKRQ